MSVGNQYNKGTLDNQLTSLATQLRDVMDQIRKLQAPVLAGGQAFLVNNGYTTTANPENPGSQSDAQFAQNLWGYLNTLQGIYYGLVQQGGTGGTGASDFNFDSALSAVWGGQ